MNNQRRKEIKKIADKIERLQTALDELREEEEAYRDNMPENLWESKRYEASEEASGYLDEAFDALEGAVEALAEIE